MWAESWLMRSRSSRSFQLMITFGRLKGRCWTGRNVGIFWMSWNSKKSSAPKAPSIDSIFCTKHMGAWLSVQGTTVTVIVLPIIKFRNFYVIVMILSPLTPKINVMVAYRPFWCVTLSSSAMEVSSSYSTIRYVTRLSISSDKPSTLTAYVVNHQSTWSAADLMRRCGTKVHF